MEVRTLRNLAPIIGVTGWIVTSVLGFYIYAVSILGAYQGSGVVAAIVTAVLPPFSQIYWLIVNWAGSGTITSPYSIACLVWLATVVVIFAAAAKMSKDDTTIDA